MTPNKEKALAALLTTGTQKAAAEAAGLDARTIRGYMADREFIDAYNAEIEKMTEEASVVARRALVDAIAFLSEVVRNEQEPTNTRLAAAKQIREYWEPLIVRRDMEYRRANPLSFEDEIAGKW